MVQTATSAVASRRSGVTHPSTGALAGEGAGPRPGATLGPRASKPARARRAEQASPAERLARALADLIGAQRFERTFGAGARFEVQGEVVTAPAANAEDAHWIARRYAEHIREAARRELGLESAQIIVLPGPAARAPADSVSPPGAGLAQRRASGASEASAAGVVDAAPSPASTPAAAFAPVHVAPARSRTSAAPDTGARRPWAQENLRRLEDFVVGPSSAMAHRAAERLLEPDCPAGFSPLFIHGECGVGKTHLLQGVAARFRELRPGARVRYTTGEAFTNAYITALKEGKVDAFRSAFRALDLLCIDDVHFLSNKTATQSEFLHTFNAIGMDGRRMAMASDEHPSRVRQFSRELVSRFVSGMVVKLDRPDQTTRVEIARRLATRRGLMLDEAGVQLIASRCVESVREIEGALSRVEAFRLILPGAMDQDVVGVGLVRQALGGETAGRPLRPLRVEAIAHGVCEALRVEMADLLGRGRHKRVVLARSVIACLSRRLTTCSFPEIARALGRPNHSTVVTAHQRILAQIAASQPCALGPDFGEEYDRMTIGELVERLARKVTRPAEAA